MTWDAWLDKVYEVEHTNVSAPQIVDFSVPFKYKSFLTLTFSEKVCK